MPKENGPLFAAFVGTAVAATSQNQCPNCYVYDGTKCVLDPNCDSTDPDVFDRECVGYEIRNETTGKCECSRRASSCNGPWQYFDSTVGVCDCVQVTCPSGYYAKGLNNCQPCPSAALASTNSGCEIKSDVSKSNLTESAKNFDGDYTGCYLPTGCSATDTTGTFVLTADCLHKTDGLGGGVIIN